MVKVGFTIVVLLKAAVLPAGRVVRLHLKVRGSPSTSVELAPVRVAVLPAGRWMKVQEKVRGSPSTSEEPAPVRCTVVPTGTVWSGPALATGGVLPGVVVM